MDLTRGEVWWATLPEPDGSGPGGRRPVLVVQSDVFNRSRIRTAVVVVLTTNLDRAAAPGNVAVPGRAAGLPKDSVANVSQEFWGILGTAPELVSHTVQNAKKYVLPTD